MSPDNPPSLAVTVHTERIFGTCSLPMTMAEACRRRAEVLPHLGRKHRTWPFEDRVLIWLLPNLEADAIAYHETHAADLAALFTPDQLALFDQSLRRELGRRLIDLEKPD